MDAPRRQRYALKLDHAAKRLDQFLAWHKEPDEKSRVASYKAFQEIAEALLDVAAMILKDKGETPTSDRDNLDRLAQESVLTTRLRDDLWLANRMRNRLAHEYNGKWDDVDLEAAADLCVSLETALEAFTEWIQKH